MKRFYLVLAGFFAFSLQLQAQCADVTLSSQADVNSFAANYGCTTLTGKLLISGSDITNLDGLSGITSVGGLTIQNNPVLTDINGLESLTTVTGSDARIEINGNLALTNIDGLSSLILLETTGTGGWLSIANNPLLKNVDGLFGLVRIQGINTAKLSLTNNEQLENIDGLSTLRAIDTRENTSPPELNITNNFALTRGCGIHNLLLLQDDLNVFIVNNGSGFSEEEIRNGNSCALVGCNGDIRLSSQADVDNFQTNYGCSIIKGSLDIIGGSDITNLDGLSQLVEANQVQIAQNFNLENIEGLSSLQTVGSFALTGSPKLTSLHGLENLTRVNDLQLFTLGIADLSGLEGLMNVTNNFTLKGNRLSSLHGIEHLIEIRGVLSILNDSTLTNLDVFPGISVIGHVAIQGNPALTSIGMDYLQETGLLSIIGNASLTNIGLSRLRTTTSLQLKNNNALTSITGFAALTSAGKIEVSGNANLTNLQGLSHITSSDGGVIVNSNPALTSLSGINLTTTNGFFQIDNNDALTDLSGLAFTHVGTMFITNNANIVSLSGLGSLQSANGGGCSCPLNGSVIGNNPKLLNVDALSALTTVGGMLQITGNTSLTNLDGLSNITTLGYNSGFGDQSIDVSNNPALVSINGFSKLTSLPGRLKIENNDALTSFNGLRNLESINLGLSVTGNAVLPNLDGLRSLARLDGASSSFVDISNNETLVNVDSLSRFSSISTPYKTLTLVNNASLTKGCGLYPLIYRNFTTSSSTSSATISGNGVTKEQILAGGPCGGTNPMTCTNVTLTVQAEVDNYRQFFGCPVITGTLKISGNDITNLDGLADIRLVNNLLIQSNPNLTNISGLKNIDTVKGALYISNNSKITSLSGLRIYYAGMVFINGNTTLTSLVGLGDLKSVGSVGCPGCPFNGVAITNNPVLQDLNMLYSLTSIEGMFILTNNAQIRQLDGLERLTSIGENAALHDGSININNNPTLFSIEGFKNLTTVSGGVSIIGSSSLKSLKGLDKLVKIPQYIRVTDNQQLTDGCSLYPALKYLDECSSCSVTVTIENNGPGLTEQQILANGPCGSPPQVICDGNVELSTQADVDAYPSAHGCNIITGMLRISGADITHLDSLISLKSAGVVIISYNPLLEDLDGLNNLTTAGGSGACDCVVTRGMVISYNPLLTNLDPLSSLTTLPGDLKLIGNQSLQNINGLSSVTQVGWNGDTPAYISIQVEDNASLTTLSGFNNLDSIPGEVLITNNDALTSLDGFKKTTGIYGGFYIAENDAMVDMNGLSSLMRVAHGLGIDNNSSLQNLDGLGSLTTLTSIPGGYLRITNNTSLTDIDSLSSLVDMGSIGRKIIVTGNTSLTRACGLYNIVSGSGFCDGCGGSLTFSDNGAEFTRESIIAAGPCDGEGNPNPGVLTFSNVTDNSMTVSFSPGSNVDGYITLMRAFQSSLPDNAPENGTTYAIGNTLGCCSIVVGMGMDSTLNVVYLEPDVEYYFDVIPFEINGGSYNYNVASATSGHQRTAPRVQPYPNPFVEELTIPFTINEESTSVKIVIFDQLGRTVSEVVNDHFERGRHEVRWSRMDLNGNRVGNGIYMYSIVTNNNEPVKGLFIAK